MRSTLTRLGILLLTLFVVLGCARRERPTPTPGPTDTPVVYPATYTPVLPPTKTPRPPTRAPDAETLKVLRAVQSTDGLNVYSAKVEMLVTSPTTSILGETPGTPLRFITMEGNVDRGNSRWLLSGALFRTATGSATIPLEMRVVNSDVYLLGPLPALGATKKGWYSTNIASDGNAFRSVGTQSTLRFFANGGVTLPAFHADGAEVLDKHSCTIYRADKYETGTYLQALGAGSQFSYGALSQFRENTSAGDLNIWSCDDGYIHKMELNFELQCTCSTRDRVTFQVDIRVWDMNIIIPVQVPNGALPLPNPYLFPTPAPDTQTS
jgi:hypothetical protein